MTDGANPVAGLVQASDGNFYGTTAYGVGFALGTVFKMTPGGTLTTLHSFTGNDGAYPSAGLVQGIDGNLYGTTAQGGNLEACSNGCGTIFKITPGGTLTTLHSFDGSDGSASIAALWQASDGDFYGTTSQGGANNHGAIFKMTPGGTLTTLHSLTGRDGDAPFAGLVQASDGNFYGTTGLGGAYGYGTAFRLSQSHLQFVPVTPCRLVDTRPQCGGNGPIPGGTYRNFPIPQEGGCNIPATAVAYSLNVSVVPQGQLAYLTIWPTGEDQPVVSTLNSLDGRIKADAAIASGGNGGTVSVYATNTTNVILDINGYFAPASGSTLAFYPLTPCRVADTRKDTFPPGLGLPHLSGAVERDFPVLSSSCIPAGVNAQAYSFNFAAVPYPTLGHPLGYLEVWPKGQKPQHPVSTLNNLTGTIVANGAIVPAGTDGEITVFATNDTDLVIDVNGYFAAPGSGGLSLYAVSPCRVIDTRKLGPPFTGTLSPPVDVVDSPCGLPATAQAYVFNATVVPQGGLGYLTLWPDGTDRPTVSTLNAIDGWITNNMAIVPSTNGKVDAFASGLTQLILDISSYFAP